MSPRTSLSEGRARHARAHAGPRVVVALAAAAALGGALAGCHPTGTPVVDPLETAAFAGCFTLLTSRSTPGPWLVVGVAGALLARGWLLVPAAAEMLVAFGAVSLRSRVSPAVSGALVGSLGSQILLRWPPHLFFGFPAAVAGAVVLICAVSAWRRSSGRIRRWAKWILGIGAALVMVVSIPVAVALLVVRAEVSQAQQAAKAAIDGIGKGASSSVKGDLATAVADTSHASNIVDSWFTAGARLIPVVAQQSRFVVGTLRAANGASRVGLAEAPDVNYHQLKYQQGHVNLVALAAMAAPLRRVDDELHVTMRRLSGLQSGWLIGPLHTRGVSLHRDVSRAAHSADLATQAARVLPAMLGGDGVRRYFVAFMSPSESRGYDGFVGSYGVLTADSGHVSLTESGAASDLEILLPPGGATLRGVSGFLARYGQFHPQAFVRDATYSPDLPTDASVLAQLYAQAGGGPVDGVLAIDPYGLAAMLRFTGPIQVPGLPVPLTSRNAAYVLLKEQYTTFDAGETNQDLLRHDFLQSALHLAFDKLVSGSLPSPETLSSVLNPVVVQGRISLWTFHKTEQPFIGALGLSGAFPASHHDNLLGVTTQDADANKIDAFLHKSISSRIAYDPGTGSISSTVTVRLTNKAPSAGLPPIIIATPAFPGLPPGTNRTWLTLYSPLAFDKVTLDGHPQPMTSGRELGVNAYSAFVNIPPGHAVTLVVHLVGSVEKGDRLTLLERLQPSANPQRNEVSVTAAPGWRLVGGPDPGEWNLGTAMSQKRSFQFAPA